MLPSLFTWFDHFGLRTGPDVEAFTFRFAAAHRVAARAFGITERNAVVYLMDRQLLARFGPWRVGTPITNIRAVSVTGPYRFAKTVGPARVSLRDGGLSFATNDSQGVCVQFHEPVTGVDPFGLVEHPNLTLTLAQPADFLEAVGSAVGREWERALVFGSSGVRLGRG